MLVKPYIAMFALMLEFVPRRTLTLVTISKRAHKSSQIQRWKFQAGRWPRTLLPAVFIFLLVNCGHTQDSQFVFDPNGNLSARSVEITAAPQILAQPQPQVVVPGALASFFVVAANTHALGYQWRFHGTNLPGATGDALLLQNVGAADAGPYSVVLVNSSGSVTSSPALLLLDGDRDGMPDSWEQTNFGGLAQNPTGDFDGDGVSNLDEFLEGTDPTDSASVLYRLTLLSDGGQVEIVPGYLKYTNGTIVTLAATAQLPEIFHGWTGAVIARTNQISLVMTNHKTLFAHFQPTVLTWVGGSGSWHEPLNWSPTLVPTAVDEVRINTGASVTLNEPAACEELIFTGGTVTGSGSLTIHGNSVWSAGTMSGSGRTIVETNGYLTLNSATSMSLTTRVLENGGTVLWSGAGSLFLNNAVITNCAGALFQAQNAASLAFNGGTPRFDNAGTFRKTSSGTTTVGTSLPFNNYNTVEVQAGTLFLDGGGLNHGTMDLPAGTTLNLSGGTFTQSVGGSIAGAGNFILSGGTANLAGLVNLTGSHTFSSGTANLTGSYFCTNSPLTISGATANFNGTGLLQPTTVTLSSGTLSGNQLVTVLTAMTWSGGTMSGSGRTIIPPAATLTLNSPTSMNLTTRVLENGGTVVWSGAGSMFLNNAVITNRAGALFQAQNAASLAFNGGTPRFDNAGTFRKTSSGTTTVGTSLPFNNYNTVEILAGILSANGGYTSTTNALLHCAIGGTTAGSGYGRLQVSGPVTLNGALSVDLVNGFVPASNNTFTVLTAGTRNGSFANFYYPSNEVTMLMSNTANSVVVQVTAVADPKPVLLQPEIVGPELKLTWTAISNRIYQLEYNPDLNPANWITLPGDVIGTSNTATKLDSLISSNRLYRVRMLPP